MKTCTIKINIFIITLLFLFNTGCVTPGGITSSSTPIHNKEYEVIGKAKGKSNFSGALFGVWTFGKPDLDIAIKDAVKKKNGDAMINVQWYERTYYFVLFSLHRVYVVGDIIKFRNAEKEEKKQVEKKKIIKKSPTGKKRAKRKTGRKGR